MQLGYTQWNLYTLSHSTHVDLALAIAEPQVVQKGSLVEVHQGACMGWWEGQSSLTCTQVHVGNTVKPARPAHTLPPSTHTHTRPHTHTHTHPHTQEACYQYWPESHIQKYGEISVESVKEEQREGYAVRSLIVTKVFTHVEQQIYTFNSLGPIKTSLKKQKPCTNI